MIPTKHHNLSLFALLAALWGTSFVAITVGLESLPPILFAALRYDIAGGLLLLYAVVARDQWRPRGRDEWTLAAVGGALVIGAHFALLFTGQQYVTSGMSAVIMSMTPVLTPLFAWFLLPDERLGLPGAVGVVFGLLGVALIASPDPGALDGTAVGVGLLILSAASFAFGAVLVKRLPASMPLVPSQAWMMLLGAASLHAVSTLRGEHGFAAIEWTPSAAASLLYLAVAAGAGGLLIYFHLLDRVGAVQTSLVNYTTPAVAALFGWAVLAEPITRSTILGFLVIVVGFALLKWTTIAARVVALAARLSRGYTVENEYVVDAEPLNTTATRGVPADD
ncbi:DMT family transporter [Haloferacaceae archaeon DSL9]